MSIHSKEKCILTMQMKCQEITSVPCAPPSSGQITRPKPLPVRNPEASTEAQFEFLGTTYLFPWMSSPPAPPWLVTKATQLTIIHQYSAGAIRLKLLDHLANITFFATKKAIFNSNLQGPWWTWTMRGNELLQNAGAALTRWTSQWL